MGIYISGIKMPRTCEDCNLESFCDLWVEARRMSNSNRAELRHPDCPLVPVPPHGDLIERDALTISMAIPLDGKPYQYVHIDNIKGAPTIIPAEPLKEGI